MDRLEIMERHWYNHNRDPFKNQNLFKDQLQRVAHIEPHILSKAVDVLSSEDIFPKIRKLLYQCLTITPQAACGTVDCNICGSMGLVIGVVYVNGSTIMDIISYKQPIKKEGSYTTRVIGRCFCENGKAYERVRENVMGKLVKPDQFLVESAMEKGWPVSFEANRAAQYFNHCTWSWTSD